MIRKARRGVHYNRHKRFFSYRYEILPQKAVLDQVALLPKQTVIHITCSQKSTVEETLRYAKLVSDQGLVAVPHIAARMVKNVEHLDKIVGFLHENRLEEVFVVGGDSPVIGEFSSGLEIIQRLRLSTTRIKIGIPAYPAGHHLIPDNILLHALETKALMADYIVTQLCFDADQIISFCSELRSKNKITLPILISVPGYHSWTHLGMIAVKLGLGESLKFVAKNGEVLSGIANFERLIRTVLKATEYSPSLNIQGFHFCTFNSVTATNKWVEGINRNK